MSNQHNPSKSLTIIESGFDKTTIKLLHLSRFCFSAYAEGKNPDCEKIVSFCKREFGSPFSIEIAIALVEVLNSMRLSRKSTFHFNSSACKKCRNRISECERLLFQTVYSMKHKQGSKAYVTALILCEGNDISPLIKAVDKLNKCLLKVERIANI